MDAMNSPSASPTPPKFFCDEMLQRLGSWLRAAGYDTLIAKDAEADYHLLRQAIDEDRLLITRDKELSEHRRAKGTVIYIEGDNLEQCAAALSAKIEINWLLEPFSRCMNCNTILIDATPQQIRALPLQRKEHIDAAFYCPQCKQVFWDGSHVKRMHRHLTDWAKKYSPAIPDDDRRRSS